MNKKTLRYALVIAASAAVSMPLLNQMLRAKDEAPAQPTVQGKEGAGAAAEAGVGQAKVDPEKVVLTIGEQKITAGEFDAFVSDLPPQYQQMAQGPGKRTLAEELIKIKLLSAEAKKRKLDQSPKVQRQMAMLQDQVLAGALAADMQGAGAGGDKEMREHYEKNKSQYGKVKARHILIRTPGSRVPAEPGKKEMTDEQAKAKADDIKKRLDKGEDFAAIAKKESDDKGSGAQGGDLGEFGHGQMVPEFEKAAFGLKKGEVSPPVKSQFGYHVIQVQDIVGGTFDEVKADLMREMGPKKMEALVADLRKANEPTLDEAYFGTEKAKPTFNPGAQ